MEKKFLSMQVLITAMFLISWSAWLVDPPAARYELIKVKVINNNFNI